MSSRCWITPSTGESTSKYRIGPADEGYLMNSNRYSDRWTGFEIKKVIFNNPATIVFWYDDSKTIVKCSDKDKFDEEKGLALCFMKKALGNTGRYNKILKKYCLQNELESEKIVEKLKKGIEESRILVSDVNEIIENAEYYYEVDGVPKKW